MTIILFLFFLVVESNLTKMKIKGGEVFNHLIMDLAGEITNVSTISDSTSVEAENTHHSSKDLEELASSLNSLVSQFKV